MNESKEVKKFKTGFGYIKIRNLKHPFMDYMDYVLEHRLVVKKFINRYLTKEEIVHHIDGNKENNSINNLMIFQNQKEHLAFHVSIWKFGLTNSIKRQIMFRWKEYKQSKEVYNREKHCGFGEPIWETNQLKEITA